MTVYAFWPREIYLAPFLLLLLKMGFSKERQVTLSGMPT